MSTANLGVTEYAFGLIGFRGAFKVGAEGAVGAIADANTNIIKSVVRNSEGVYTVTLETAKNGIPVVPTQILTPLCGVTVEDVSPAAGELVTARYVSGSWNPTTRAFKLVTVGIDDELVEDPDATATVWFYFVGPYNPTAIDKSFTL